MRSLNSIGQQGGGVLIMTLVFLLILTVVVSGASNSSVMQEKMTLAVKDSNVALERAEEALREAEDFIKNTDNATIESKAFFFAPNEAPDPFAAATWVDTDNTPASAANGNAGYFIEMVGPYYNAGSPQVQLGDVSQEIATASVTGYRVVARGTVKSGNQVQAQRLLVVYFKK